MGFSRKEYWSGLPCAFPGDLLNPWIVRLYPRLICLLHWQVSSLPLMPPEKSRVGDPNMKNVPAGAVQCPTAVLLHSLLDKWQVSHVNQLIKNQPVEKPETKGVFWSPKPWQIRVQELIQWSRGCGDSEKNPDCLEPTEIQLELLYFSLEQKKKKNLILNTRGRKIHQSIPEKWLGRRDRSK